MERVTRAEHLRQVLTLLREGTTPLHESPVKVGRVCLLIGVESLPQCRTILLVTAMLKQLIVRLLHAVHAMCMCVCVITCSFLHNNCTYLLFEISLETFSCVVNKPQHSIYDDLRLRWYITKLEILKHALVTCIQNARDFEPEVKSRCLHTEAAPHSSCLQCSSAF